MKKIKLLTGILIFLLTGLSAQQVPLGMQYQAVARDLQGNILPNQEITLKINLVGDEKSSTIYYSEVHKVTTNLLGLFTLVIGAGKTEKGTFSTIPWSSENIWMQVAIKEKGKADFATISNSKLLAVPYAFHAGTANQITGMATRSSSTNSISMNTVTAGVPAQVWSLKGNRGVDTATDHLGTTDYQDLIIITNNTERMRIKANGDISMKRSLSIGANLIADSSVVLNRVSGSTINYGPFTVGSATRLSPTKLAGTLTVDGATILNNSLAVNGPTDLNSRLNVNNLSPTYLTGTLRVDGITDLNSSLNVNNMSPAVLTGTLLVNQDATFKQHVLLDNPGLQSTSTTTGALVIAGGLGLGKNLNVGGDANFGGHTTFGGAVRITDQTPSVDTGTGALIVTGGVGIGKQLNVGGATNLSSTLAVNGNTNIYDATQSTSTTTGALIIAGGVGIGKNVNIGGSQTTTGATILNSTLAANGQVTINAGTSGGQSSYDGYPLRVQGSDQGIAVKVGGSRSTNNNYVSFWDDNGMQGRIEGQTLDELHNNDPDYKNDLASHAYDVTGSVIDLLFASTDLGMTIADQIAADASVNACAGLGIVACPPIASLIAGSLVNVGLAVAQEAVVIADVAFASVNLNYFITSKDANIGVTYQSGAGDYAEYLMRSQKEEKIFPGDIVGVKGGKVSKKTEGADKMMVISHKPIVLGNMPQQGNEGDYEKVAFMGQVPVKVFGKVNLGDYIIANGVDNGVGIAVAPDKIEAKDIRKIVGVAWGTASKGFQFSMVNVAVGLNVNDNQKLIEEQQQQITDLKNQIAQTNTQLERLVPGFKSSSVPIVTSQPAAQYKLSKNSHKAFPVYNAANSTDTSSTGVTYNVISKDDLIHGFELAYQTSKNNGMDVENNVFWKKYNSDPSYKDFTINRIMTKYNDALAKQKAADSNLNK